MEMTYSEAYTGDFILDIGVVIKELVLMVKTENKMDKNMERSPLKYQVTRLRFLRQMRIFPGLFLALGRITYSYLPNRFFI